MVVSGAAAAAPATSGALDVSSQLRGSSASSSVSASQKMVPRAKSSMILPFGAHSVGGVGKAFGPRSMVDTISVVRVSSSSGFGKLFRAAGVIVGGLGFEVSLGELGVVGIGEHMRA